MEPDDSAATVAASLCAQGWRPAAADSLVLRRRYRERFGAWGVVWTKAVIVLWPDGPAPGDDFSRSAWRTGLRKTRFVLPPRGCQGATLVLAVANGKPDDASRAWALAKPQVKFATMCATALIDSVSGDVITNRDVPAVGRLLHQRRLEIARELSKAATKSLSL